MATYTGTVNIGSGNLYMRSNPSMTASVVTKIPNGTKLNITAITTYGGWKWGKTTYNGKTGYCCIVQPGHGTWITIKSDESNKTSPTKKDSTNIKKSEGDTGNSKGLDSALTTLLNSSVNNGNPLKASMRLFGLPYQLMSHVDPRIKNVSSTLGRTFINNIILEAPILTIIPGKPVYLPAAKNKRGITQTMLQAADGAFSELAAMGKTLNTQDLRYFDFQQDYLEYIKYVNALCRVAACFLGIGDVELDGVKLSHYNWANYRFTASSYQSVLGNVAKSTVDAAKSTLDMIKTYGADALYTVTSGAVNLNGKKDKSNQSKVKFENEKADKSLATTLEQLMTATNFVQFYCTAEGGQENYSNETSTSKLEGLFDTGTDLAKELAFVVNAGGASQTQFAKFIDSSSTALSDAVTKAAKGSVTGLFSRIISSSTNVLRGHNIVMPEIYQRSSNSSSWTFKLELSAAYNDVYSFYMRLLVPYLFVICLMCPKQTTANSYSSPFLIRGSMPGVYNCNMGIMESCTVEKWSEEGETSSDGFPTKMTITFTIKDLYSDLMITPSNQPMMFLSNSSLIDFLAINCGLDVTKPQLQAKLDNMINTITNAFEDIPNNAINILTQSVDNLVSDWTRIS